MDILNLYYLIAFLPLLVDSSCVGERKFPDTFKFGVATSSYQIEGGWNADGKGPNIWDYTVHVADPGWIYDGSNADVTCDSYHHYKEDVNMLKFLGVDFYRFSLSWARILPDGSINKVNQKGVDYYNNLLTELEAAGIEPMVTLYHWDMPLGLKKMGGLTNESFVDYFGDYARLAFKLFGDKVKVWSTFNEPRDICVNDFPLMVNDSSLDGIAQYLCAHNLIKSHAKAYHIYSDEFRETQKGRISIIISTDWWTPATNSSDDVVAAQRAMDFDLGWYANPIYKNGDYPVIMRQIIDKRSQQEGFKNSRLPTFTKEESEYIKGTFDYFGINGYTATLVANTEFPIGKPSIDKDKGVILSKDDSWGKSASDWLRVVPWSMRKLLNYIKNTYNNPEVLVTENGFSDSGEIIDLGRVSYHQEYLSNVLDAMEEDKVNVTAYIAWSLLDNFEWQEGYSAKFGFYHVDFTDENRTRTPKLSAILYKALCSTKKLLCNCR